MTSTEDKIKVMQAFADGKKIEVRPVKIDRWEDTCKPLWNWSIFDYRIKPLLKDFINWDHVHPDYKWMARDEDGRVYLYPSKPVISKNGFDGWEPRIGGEMRDARAFSSYRQGEVDWTESLVERP